MSAAVSLKSLSLGSVQQITDLSLRTEALSKEASTLARDARTMRIALKNTFKAIDARWNNKIELAVTKKDKLALLVRKNAYKSRLGQVVQKRIDTLHDKAGEKYALLKCHTATLTFLWQGLQSSTSGTKYAEARRGIEESLAAARSQEAQYVHRMPESQALLKKSTSGLLALHNRIYDAYQQAKAAHTEEKKAHRS